MCEEGGGGEVMCEEGGGGEVMCEEGGGGEVFTSLRTQVWMGSSQSSLAPGRICARAQTHTKKQTQISNKYKSHWILERDIKKTQ